MSPHVHHAKANVPDPAATPFVKWAGGKRKIFSQLEPLLPEKIGRYIEPFVGGGAMFFALEKRLGSVILSDVNGDLIEAYRGVQTQAGLVIKELRRLSARSRSSEGYYDLRNAYNQGYGTDTVRAAWFIFLNRTCFNGLYRCNKKGEFNVPWGNPSAGRDLVREAAMWETSRALYGVELRCESFEYLEEEASEGDFVYFDPPYLPTGKQSFTGYNRGGFGIVEHTKLRKLFGALDKRGCKLMISGSDTEEFKVFFGLYHITEVQAPRSINSDGTGRGNVTELVARNYQ